jgi:hypothetical protein
VKFPLSPLAVEFVQSSQGPVELEISVLFNDQSVQCVPFGKLGQHVPFQYSEVPLHKVG